MAEGLLSWLLPRMAFSSACSPWFLIFKRAAENQLIFKRTADNVSSSSRQRDTRDKKKFLPEYVTPPPSLPSFRVRIEKFKDFFSA
jgi:hypothetical protein